MVVKKIYITNRCCEVYMKRKVLLFLISIAASFSLLAACSDNSDSSNAVASDDSVINVPPNTSELKGLSHDFKTSSCKSHLAKWYDGHGEEYIDFYVNEDGSATVNMESSMGCDGFYSMMYETRNDTLFVEQNYSYEIKELNPVTGDSVVVEYGYHMSKCVCLIDLELRIPSKFIGTKYVDFEGDCREIIYKKNK